MTARAKVSSIATQLSDADRLTLSCVERGGLHAYHSELAYQLGRRGQPANRLLDQLAALEASGLLESAVVWRLTDRGRDELPDSHNPPPRAGVPTPWTAADRPPALASFPPRPRRKREVKS